MIAAKLTGSTILDKNARAFNKGFAKHEARRVGGSVEMKGKEPFAGLGFNHCRRGFGPHTKSKKWGHDYESWTFSGESALLGAKLIRYLEIDHTEAKCTRADCAFDYFCDSSLTPTGFRDAHSDHWENLGLIPGISGEGELKAHSAYLGTLNSERRICIYRKDIESPYSYPYPTLRVEMRLRGDFAQGAFYALGLGDQAFAKRCGGHVLQMMGFQPIADDCEIPIRESKPKTKFASALAAMVDQWCDVLTVANREGIDLEKLCNRRLARSSPMAKSRRRARTKEVREAGKEQIEAEALAIIGV